MEEKRTKKINPQKVEAVSSLKDKIGKAKAFFLTDYRGLTHQQLEQLRKALKKVEGEFLVAKNTLMKLALKQSNNEAIEQLNNELNNPTATLFAFGDEIAAIKALAQFINTVQLPKVKIGIFSGKTATGDDFKKLAALPTREVLLTTLVMRMKSPIYNLHYALNWNLQRLVTVLSNIKGEKPEN
jgi:large subunit ribosomal protein L10